MLQLILRYDNEYDDIGIYAILTSLDHKKN